MFRFEYKTTRSLLVQEAKLNPFGELINSANFHKKLKITNVLQSDRHSGILNNLKDLNSQPEFGCVIGVQRVVISSALFELRDSSESMVQRKIIHKMYCNVRTNRFL